MISYDDLVAALQAWRARQGLPVEQPGPGPRSVAPPPTAPPPAPRTNPPAPPMSARSPLPLQDPDDGDEREHEEIDERALIDDQHYESEGDDFAMSFARDGHNGHLSGVDGADGTETMLGHDPNHDPDRPSELTDPAAAQRNGRDDW